MTSNSLNNTELFDLKVGVKATGKHRLLKYKVKIKQEKEKKMIFFFKVGPSKYELIFKIDDKQ